MRKLLREAYRLIPFKRPVFELARKFVRPSENVFKHLHFQGDFSVKIDDTHSFLMHHFGFELENAIFWGGVRGGWEKTSISLWIRLVQKADVIIDIGANTGIYSLVAKAIHPEARVYALEPIKRVFEKLEYNNELNDFDIVCLECAASDKDGTAIVYDTPTEHIYSVTVNKNLQSPDADVIPTEIKISRLDTLIRELELEKLDLIKIDVETHEPEVLAGLGEYLDRFKPSMLVEILNDEVGRRVEDVVTGKGYVYFNLDEKSDSIRRVDSITKSDFYNYLLCSELTVKELGLTV